MKSKLLTGLPKLVLGMVLLLAIALRVSAPVHAASLAWVDPECPSVSIDPGGTAVCNPPATIPVCRPNFVLSGNTATLSANCTPGPITAYSWTSSAGGGAVTTNPFQVPGNYVAGTTYTLTATNGFGSSAPASVTLSAPVCTLTPAAWVVNPSAGIPVTLTAYCPGAATYEWSADNFTSTFTPTTPTTVVGIVPTATTTISVRGTNPLGTGAPASAVGTAPDAIPPTVPTGLSAAAASTTQINLSWTASTDTGGVTAYKVYRGGSLIATLGNVTSYSNTGLTAGTTYSYTVAACDAGGNCSAQSTAASATTQAGPDTTPPTTPTGLSATAVSSSRINLSWTASTDNVGVTNYGVYRNGSMIAYLGNVTSYSDTYQLQISTTYSYTVRAFDAAHNGSGLASTASATTLATAGDTTAPTVPTGLSATAASSTQINLSWTASTDAVGVTAYKVYRGGSLIATLGNVTSYSNTGLTAATQYSYTVAACDLAGNCSAQSTAASATTQGDAIAGCTTTATKNYDWGWAQMSQVLSIAPNQTISIKFTTGPSTAVSGGFTTVETLDFPAADRYAAISTCPGDFSSQLATTAWCYADGSALSADVRFYVGSANYYCTLQPNTTYYYNLRHANPSPMGQFQTFTETCTASNCGAIVQFGHAP